MTPKTKKPMKCLECDGPMLGTARRKWCSSRCAQRAWRRLHPPRPLENPEDWPRVKDAWLAFDYEHPPAKARLVFHARIGHEPAEMMRAGTLLLVGPLPPEAESN